MLIKEERKDLWPELGLICTLTSWRAWQPQCCRAAPQAQGISFSPCIFSRGLQMPKVREQHSPGPYQLTRMRDGTLSAPFLYGHL